MIAMFLLSAFVYEGSKAHANGGSHTASQWGIASAAMVFTFTFVFGATWLTVPWLYLAEISPSLSGQMVTLWELLVGLLATAGW